MLLPLAVKAKIPLIAVQTDDTLNVRKVLSELSGDNVKPFPKKAISVGQNVYDIESMKAGSVYTMMRADPKINFEKLHEQCADKQCSVILVNPIKDHPTFFDAGYITCPQSLIEKFVDEQFSEDDEATRSAFVAAFSGLSYKVIVDLTLMAQAEAGGGATVRAVRSLRAKYFGNVRGLQQETSEVGFYQPEDDLVKWLKTNGPLFLHATHASMVPRGLLFDGPPGTGKTMGAKYIATALNVPLYRLDIAATMDKYIGESEHGLTRALAQADQCAPCVLLLDEVEKLFQQSHDGGVTTRLLSQLLWWLQEHRSRVLTVMTTNRASSLPPELIRPGRIDRSYKFSLMSAGEGRAFLATVATKHEHIAKVPAKVLKALADRLYPYAEEKYSAAELTQEVLQLVKDQYASTLQ